MRATSPKNEPSASSLDLVFHAFRTGHRGSTCSVAWPGGAGGVTELAHPYRMSLPAASKRYQGAGARASDPSDN